MTAQQDRPEPDLRPVPPPPALADSNADNREEVVPWNWADLSDTQALSMAQTLSAFVAFYNGRYAWTQDHTIPPCWAEHGALVEEITTLMWSRWAAFQGPLASPDAAQAWHTNHLIAFSKRIAQWIGAEAAIDCRSGRHEPLRECLRGGRASPPMPKGRHEIPR